MNYIYRSTILIFSFISFIIYNYTADGSKQLTERVVQKSNQNMYSIKTEIGDIIFEVYPKKAPKTVKNFLKYIDMANFDGADFYRVVRMDNQPNDSIRIEVIQGNFTSDKNSLGNIEHEITKETGVLHENGTISMARSTPGSASLAFFICINDQPELDFGGKRNPDGQGFAAFGKVIEGMDVVRLIQSGATDSQSLKKTVAIEKIIKL